jgi:quinate dehydrogenase
MSSSTSKGSYYLAGKGVRHSIAPSVHQTVADHLGLPWTFKLLDVDSVEELMAVFRRDDFTGGVVTMPYKKTILDHLDELDDRCRTLGSCNNVYRSVDDRLVGSNTDWIGVLECLRTRSTEGIGKPALLIGAGGAARAAVYALHTHLSCKVIYVINRDDQEIADLEADTRSYGTTGPRLIHIKSRVEAESLEASPFFVVGTVPDIEPRTARERANFDILRHFFGTGERGVFLDMCFNPRNTRFLKLAVDYGWQTVEGINVIGWQLREQYTLWAGKEAGDNIPEEQAWAALRRAADASPYINK